MTGIMAAAQVVGFLIACYFTPPLAVYSRMDPGWELSVCMFPDCLSEDKRIANNVFCQFWFIGVRSFLAIAWITNTGRNLCTTQLMAWIFFDMFNECAKKIEKIRDNKRSLRWYWAYWKITTGFQQWSKVGLASGLCAGTWLFAVSTCISVMVLPYVRPFSFVYLVFPVSAITGFIAFSCVPLVVRFPRITKKLIEFWNGHDFGTRRFERKVMKKELAAMQHVVPKVGVFFDLDRSGVLEILKTAIDSTIDLMISYSVM